MLIAIMKFDKETEEEGKKRGMSLKKGNQEQKKSGWPMTPNLNTILINKIYYYFTQNGKDTMIFNSQK